MVPASALRHAPARAARRSASERAIILGAGKVRSSVPTGVVGAKAKILMDLVAVDRLVGVQLVLRIPDALEGAERRSSAPGRTSSAEAHRGPGPSPCSPESEPPCAMAISAASSHEAAEVRDALLRLKIEAEPHVDAPLSKVPMHRAPVTILLHQRIDGAQVAAQLRRTDGSVTPIPPARTFAGTKAVAPSPDSRIAQTQCASACV